MLLSCKNGISSYESYCAKAELQIPRKKYQCLSSLISGSQLGMTMHLSYSRPFGKVKTLSQVAWGGMLLTWRGRRPEMLSEVLQRPGQLLTTEDYPAQHVSSAKVEQVAGVGRGPSFLPRINSSFVKGCIQYTVMFYLTWRVLTLILIAVNTKNERVIIKIQMHSLMIILWSNHITKCAPKN